MKKLYVFILLLAVLCTVAQAQRRAFLRFYSLAGNKFNKGYFYATTDSSILIYKDSSIREILASNIGYIKTRRSLGHNILIGTLTGTIPLSIIGAAGGEQPVNDGTFGGAIHDMLTLTPAEGAEAGAIVGGIIGTATGALITAFTKHTTFTINGNIEQWRSQRKTIDLLRVYKK